MIYEEIASNKRKSLLLVFLFFVVIATLGYAFGLYIGSSYAGIILAVIISVIYALVSYYSGDRMILAVSHAHPVEKKDYPHLYNAVEGLSIAAGIPMPKVYIIDDTAINAFATGRDPEHASITVTKGAVEKLKRVELEGVVGHEMSHVKNYDIRMMMLTAVLVGVTVLLSDMMLRSFIYGRRDHRKSGGNTAIFILLGFVLAILAPLIAKLIQLAVSRKREFLADADGALLTRHPKGLADALKRIKDDKEPLVDSANKATAHLYIANPLRNFKGVVNSLFSTHPDIDERIRRLKDM